MSNQPSRHFVTIRSPSGTRQVHYRRSGHGPLLLLLHQSPQSSREMMPLMRDWSRSFTLAAPDTPGYGLSDPLPDPGEGLAAFARATLEFADAIGARRFGIYGFHTGASIGMALASMAPERVTALACNGLILPEPHERAELLDHYLPPLVPRWDGAHLGWAWARLREQALFFPWYRRESAARRDCDLPGPENLQQSLIELLTSGDHYASAYRGAFAHDTRADLARLSTPALVIASAHDPLAGHIPRLDGGCSAERRIAPDAGAALAAAYAHLLANPGDPPGRATSVPGGDRWRELVADGHGGQACLLHTGAADGQPLLLLHAPGSAAELLAAEAGSLPGKFHIVMPDLPGHGASDRLPGDSPDLVEATLGTLESILHQSPASTRSAGIEAGGLLVAEAARRAGRPTTSLLVDPPLWKAEYRAEWRTQGLPPLTPAWHGGHLAEYWHLVRDSCLFFPWYRRSRDAILQQVPALEDRLMQERVVAMLQSHGHWQALLDGLLAQDWREYTGLLPASRIAWTNAQASVAGKRMSEAPEPRRHFPELSAALSALE
ncbi:MAG: alpha/beta hydrolase [Chromatiales bacterium]|nr:alpha/beta hydrolase [Chromatiales bacterium]